MERLEKGDVVSWVGCGWGVGGWGVGGAMQRPCRQCERLPLGPLCVPPTSPPPRERQVRQRRMQQQRLGAALPNCWGSAAGQWHGLQWADGMLGPVMLEPALRGLPCSCCMPRV